MIETWKHINGHNYSVSSCGRIRNDKTQQILSPWLTSHGYPSVTLWRGGKGVKRPVHRLVAEAFIPNPDNKPCIDHINTVTTDNRVENLRWVTMQENSRNPITLDRLRKTTFKAGALNPKTMTGKTGALNPRSRPVVQHSKDGEFIRRFSCAREAMRETGIDCSVITNVCRHKPSRKTAGGFIWKYEDERL